MECTGLKLAPALVRHLLSTLGLYGPIADTSRTHSHSKQLQML